MTVAPAVANQTNPTANPPPQQQTAPNLGSTNLVLDHLHPHPCPNDRDSHQPHSRNYRYFYRTHSTLFRLGAAEDIAEMTMTQHSVTEGDVLMNMKTDQIPGMTLVCSKGEDTRKIGENDMKTIGTIVVEN